MLTIEPAASEDDVFDLVSSLDPSVALNNPPELVLEYRYRDTYALSRLEVPASATIYQMRQVGRAALRAARRAAGREWKNGERVKDTLVIEARKAAEEAKRKAEEGDAGRKAAEDDAEGFYPHYTRLRDRLGDEDAESLRRHEAWEERRCRALVAGSIQAIIIDRDDDPEPLRFTAEERFDPEWFCAAVEATASRELQRLADEADALREQIESLTATVPGDEPRDLSEAERAIAAKQAKRLEAIGIDSDEALKIAESHHAHDMPEVLDCITRVGELRREMAVYEALDGDAVIAELARHIEAVSKLGKGRWTFCASPLGMEDTPTPSGGSASSA